MKNDIIIYGTDTQIGLALIRELGKRGCNIVGIGKSADSIGLSSKYINTSYVLQPGDDDHKIKQLKKISRKTGAKYLLCVSEDDILFFNRIRKRLGDLTPLVPEQAQIEKVLDKEYTASIARPLGIATPKSYSIDYLAELPQLMPLLHFPVILKWSNPHAVITAARAQDIAIEKLVYCHSKQELDDCLKRYQPLKQYPMIQEYCPGYGLGQFFFMHKGEALLRFQHKRLHEWPPEGGVSTLCAAVPLSEHQELQQKSIALLNRIGWEGVAMVEYRYDDKNQRPVLMEINGRFWGSLPLAYHAGVPFAWYSYQVLGLGQIPKDTLKPRDDIQCRNTLTEIKRLIRIIFKRKTIQDKQLDFSAPKELWTVLSGFFNPNMRYYLFDLHDMAPLIKDWLSIFKKAKSKFKV